MRLGAIDIGSNAVRLMVADVYTEENGNIRVNRHKIYRVPVRLGLDSFSIGMISKENRKNLRKTMQSFQLLMEVFEVEAYSACATSAMREAANGDEVVKFIEDKTGIQIQIIDGKEEAALMLANKRAIMDIVDQRYDHLYVDVGGGSTEISLVSNQGIDRSRSFKIGTIRLLKNKVKEKTWVEMTDWLQAYIAPFKPLTILGAGGNINRVYRRSNNAYGQPLVYRQIEKELALLSALSVDDRIRLQGLTPDRAEVIVPALTIFERVMKVTGIQQVIVPKMGVADGIARRLYLQKRAEQERQAGAFNNG